MRIPFRDGHNFGGKCQLWKGSVTGTNHSEEAKRTAGARRGRREERIQRRERREAGRRRDAGWATGSFQTDFHTFWNFC